MSRRSGFGGAPGSVGGVSSAAGVTTINGTNTIINMSPSAGGDPVTGGFNQAYISGYLSWRWEGVEKLSLSHITVFGQDAVIFHSTTATGFTFDMSAVGAFCGFQATAAGGVTAVGAETNYIVCTNNTLLVDISYNPLANITPSTIGFVKPLQGDAATLLTPSTNVPLQFSMLLKTWPSDANYTLSATELVSPFVVLSGGSLSATRNLVLPVKKGAAFWISNQTTGAHSIVAIGASGTGITIATGKSAWVVSDGTNYLRMTADV